MKKSNRVINKRFNLNSNNIEKIYQNTRVTNTSTSNSKKILNILNGVKKDGDNALMEYGSKFDKVKLRKSELVVTKEEISEAYDSVTDSQIKSIQFLKQRIEKVEKSLLKTLSNFQFKENGVDISLRINPIDSVGCYVPGGKAVYPSSLIMCAVPAIVAGVKRIVVCSPPSPNKKINPLILVAGDMCCIREFYKIGGAQAIGALAYGTKTIQPVQKIVGPGSIFVSEAKRLVSNTVSIDMPAGPTELIVLSDNSKDIDFIASDMISQAEHGPDSVCGLITTSKTLFDNFERTLSNKLMNIERKKIVTTSLTNNGFMIYSKDMDLAIDFINRFAPEHLELLTSKNSLISKKITASGIVLLGPYTPAASSDYGLGTNHVLPTEGYSKTNSNLSSLDYIRRFYVAKCSKKSLAKYSEMMQRIAYREGLINHAESIKERFSDN